MRRDRNLLYVAPHGLGDLVMSMRAIEFLVRHGYCVTVLVKDAGQGAYLRHTVPVALKGILVLDDYRKWGRGLGLVVLVCKLLMGRFAAAVPQVHISFRKFDLLLRFANIPNRRAVSLLRAIAGERHGGWKRHKVNMNVELAARIVGLPAIEDPMPVWPTRAPRSLTAPRIALAPGSEESTAHKRWPAAHYAALAAKIAAACPEAEIRIFGAPNEASLCEEVARLSNGAAKIAATKSVTEFHDALRDTDICIANCNGASHVAAHAGAIVVGIYGPTEAEHTGVYCSTMFKLSRNLECSPCYRWDYLRGCGDPVCMTGLAVDTVAATVFGILDEAGWKRDHRPQSTPGAPRTSAF